VLPDPALPRPDPVAARLERALVRGRGGGRRSVRQRRLQLAQTALAVAVVGVDRRRRRPVLVHKVAGWMRPTWLLVGLGRPWLARLCCGWSVAMAGCGRGRQWPWLDATSFGRSGWWRPGDGEAGGVLRARDISGGEVVGAPLLFLGDNAGLVLPWWWGWQWLRGGATGCVGPLPAEALRERWEACFCHGWERATGLVLIPGESLH
jgi:hypothetical protein